MQQHLTDLTDKIGPRLSGTLQLTAAMNQLADAMRSLPAQVTLQLRPHCQRLYHVLAVCEHAQRNTRDRS
jgi:hypothetical protein